VIKTVLVILTSISVIPLLSAEEATPLNQTLTPGSTTMITCFAKKKEKIKSGGGKGTDEDPSKADWKKAYHYRLYIPQNYDKNPKKHFPCMFIADPGGNAKMQNMEERLKKEQWIVVMLVESKNNTTEWLVNFIAAHDDVIKRVRLIESCKFATGFSGGARCLSEYPLYRKGFKGLLLQSAGFFDDYQYEKYPSSTVIAATFGVTDFNFYESQELRRELNSKVPRHIEFFNGGHSWAPKAAFEHSMNFLEDTICIKTKKASKQMKDMFVWFIDLNLEKLESAETNLDKYMLIKKILSIATNGKLLSDKRYKTKLASLKNQLAELRKDKDVFNEFKAEIAFKKVQSKIKIFDKQMLRNKAVYKKISMSKKDKTSLKAMKKEMTNFIKQYHGQRIAANLQDELDSLEKEYSKIEMSSKH